MFHTQKEKKENKYFNAIHFNSFIIIIIMFFVTVSNSLVVEAFQ